MNGHTELFLIRHGQSFNNSVPDEQRIEDPPLTETGRRQCEHLADWMAKADITRLVTSPFRRTLETTEYIRRAINLQPHVWIEIHEQGGCQHGYEAISYRGAPGMTAAEITKDYPDYLLPDGLDGDGWWRCQPYETMDAAHTRAELLVKRFLDELSGEGGRIAFVMHGTFKQVLLGAMFGAPVLARPWLGDVYNTAVTKIVLDPRTPRLAYFNFVGHLPQELVT